MKRILTIAAIALLTTSAMAQPTQPGGPRFNNPQGDTTPPSNNNQWRQQERPTPQPQPQPNYNSQYQDFTRQQQQIQRDRDLYSQHHRP